MYKNILVCLDNSDHATAGIELAVRLTVATGASVTGCHVYAARLHDMRFRQMEGGLPPRYQDPAELKRQRDIHDDLITRGLKVISDSYMAVLAAKASQHGITAKAVQREGRNYVEILREVDAGGYDLVIMGAMGLGATTSARLGSVAERVVRRCPVDVLVVKDAFASPPGRVMAAVDGSPRSFGALARALAVAGAFSSPVELVSAFDPEFHYTAFRSIAGVLTEEASRVFRFSEQEKLHSEIIDNGLKKIYEDHLNAAAEAAAHRGFNPKKTLLSGKPADRLSGHIAKAPPFLLALGRTGVHSEYIDDPGARPDIGSVAENCLREAPCNVLITSKESAPPEAKALPGPPWTPEALGLLSRIPPFARNVAKKIVEEAARKAGISEITEGFMRRVRERMDL